MTANHVSTPQSSFPVLLRAQEVAKILNIGESTAYMLMQHGDIPSVKVGKSVRVLPDDLMQYIQHSRTNTN